MAKNKRLSRDQKRKAKLKKREVRSTPRESLIYQGNKYKNAAWVPFLFATETGIFETFVMLDGRLTDPQVEHALEQLILALRKGPLPPLEDAFNVTISPGAESDLVIQSIRRNWARYFEERSPVPRDDVIGVLRTLLGSIDVWKTPRANSQGYVHYLKGFMKEAGVSVRKVSELDELESPEPPDPLIELGRAWQATGDPRQGAEFRAEVEALFRQREYELVADLCQELMGEAQAPWFLAEVQVLALRAQRAMAREPDQGPSSLPGPS